MKHSVLLFLLVCIFVLPTGCGRGELPHPPGMPKIYPTTLTITQDGKPLANATVGLFAIDGENATWTPSGVTDANGKAIMLTRGQFRGAAVGKYKVTVAVTEYVDGTVINEQGEIIGPEMPTKIFTLVEMKYRKSTTTPLELEVTTKGVSDATFDVGKAVRVLMKPSDF